VQVKKRPTIIGILLLVLLALVGWYVLLVQKPDILFRARLRYNDVLAKKIDLSSGPCLGKIADDWVLDIAHLPRETIDDIPANQCEDYRTGKVRHFAEMSPAGEVTRVQ